MSVMGIMFRKELKQCKWHEIISVLFFFSWKSLQCLVSTLLHMLLFQYVHVFKELTLFVSFNITQSYLLNSPIFQTKWSFYYNLCNTFFILMWPELDWWRKSMTVFHLICESSKWDIWGLASLWQTRKADLGPLLHIIELKKVFILFLCYSFLHNDKNNLYHFIE